MPVVPLEAPRAPGITPRRFEAGPRPRRFWYRDNVVMTHRANAVNLLFPLGERFFIRSVLAYADRVTDPALQARIKAFAAQEAHHGRAHERQFADLEAEGFEIRSWLERYERLAYRRLEPLAPKALRLAITAALEHLTATMATHALGEEMFEGADPAIVEMLRWHAVEEIEHKDVAYDVLTATGGSYALRVVGMAAAVVALIGFWDSAYRHLIVQERSVDATRLARDLHATRQLHFRTGIVREALTTWLRPGFHPNDVDNRGMAEAWLAAQGVG